MSDSHCAPGKKVVYFQISIATIEKVDALLYDHFRGKRQKGRRNDLIEELLLLWIREEERRTGTKAETLVAAIKEQGGALAPPPPPQSISPHARAKPEEEVQDGNS